MNTLPAKRTKDLLEARSKGFATWSLSELIEYSVGNCHKPAKREISIIYDLAHVIAYKHGDSHPRLGKLIETLFLSSDNLLRHLRMEESTIFPVIAQAAGKIYHPYAIGNATPEYLYQLAETIPKAHDAIAKDFEIFRELTGYYTIPDNGDFLFKYLFEKMKRFDREMSFQMHLENTILIPKAIALARELSQKKCRPNIFWNDRIEHSKL